VINLFNYIDRPSPIHRLTGATKLVCLLIWTFAAMGSFDPRLLFLLAALSIGLFGLSRIHLKDVRFMLGITFWFMVLNNVLIFLFSPEHGVELYGARHALCQLPFGYAVTEEQLFYQLNVVLKYFATIPVVLLFVCTTQPSEFAASLNRIGLSYKLSYSVALALRYIPDIEREYRDIALSHQARGIEMGRGVPIIQRIKNASAILFPLILSSMDRIESIASAMELRGFGKNKKRSWYSARPFQKADYFAITFSALLLMLSVALNVVNGGRFYNPFMGR
jgi:energy-coupling factor transport system permease protein